MTLTSTCPPKPALVAAELSLPATKMVGIVDRVEADSLVPRPPRGANGWTPPAWRDLSGEPVARLTAGP